MLPDAKKISELIRMKKKKMLEANPELVDTDSHPDINPNEMEDIHMNAEIQSSLDSPDKIDAREKSLDVTDEMGLSEDEKKRMGRLRTYISGLDYDEEQSPMTAKELKKLIKTLRAAGVSYYKEGDIELKLGDEAFKVSTKKKTEPIKDLTPEEHEEIKHKLDNIKKTFLGSDEELLDTLFPVPPQEQESA